MLRPSTCIMDPLSTVEIDVLKAHALQAVPAKYEPSPEWALATQQLVSRGMLVRSKKSVVGGMMPTGFLPTPEGLAAVMDTISIDTMTLFMSSIRMAAPPASKERAKSGVAKRPSKAQRR